MDNFIEFLKGIFWVAALIVLSLLLVGGLFACSTKVGKEQFEAELEGYSIITVNGEDYQIKDIVDIYYSAGGYEEDKIKITLSDGTKVIFSENAYTLKK